MRPGRLRVVAGWKSVIFSALILLPGCPGIAQAARIGDITEIGFAEQAARFFTFQDPALRDALIGSLLLGLSCGLMGAFLVVRKLALMGDALSHAVLPGVALGFLWSMSKDPVAIFIGATLAGLLGAGVVQVIRSTTKHKEDAALGFVLASFFGVGICLFSMIQNLPGGNKSGLDKFMFGQAASLDADDIRLLAIVACIVLAVILVFYKEFKLTSFDPGFAGSIGMPVQMFHYALMLLLAFAIVSALQAVGVVLVSAMLVIPAAAAYLLTDRFGTMLVLSALFGMGAGGLGAFCSFVGRNLPTGPFMVLSAAAIFVGALLFGPRHGILLRVWRHKSRAEKIRMENALKSLYHIFEEDDFRREEASTTELAQRRRMTFEDIGGQLERLKRSGLVTTSGDGVSFTPRGWQRACEIVRNHRLWELYLTNAAQIAADHVHDDAEVIEHVIGAEMVRKLERRLNYARLDPHGKLIPGVRDIHPHRRDAAPVGRQVGYGRDV